MPPIHNSKLAVASPIAREKTQREHKSAVEYKLPYSTKSDVYPFDESRSSVYKKIDDVTSRRTILAGPNCWGTVSFLLGIIPTLRYVSDIEYGQFIAEAKIIKCSNEAQLKDGAVLSIWSNAEDSIAHHHASLVIDGSLKKLFEKPGPNESDKPDNKFFGQVMNEASSTAFPNIRLANQFNQPIGKYATLLDFSEVSSKSSSDFEDKLDAYNREGRLLNKEALKELLEVYKTEVNAIRNPRELSLAEGFNYLLQSISDELLKIDELRERAKLAGDRPTMLAMAKLLSSYSELRSIIDQARDFTHIEIQAYRKSL